MSETFNVDIDKQLVKLPSGYYKGIISEYEIKHFQNSVGLILTIPIMKECYPAKTTVFVNNKSPQLSILMSLIGYELPFTGTFDPKDTINKEVFIRIQEGKGYKGYDKHEFIYEFQYKSGHGVNAQSYTGANKKETVETQKPKQFKKMDKPQEEKDNSPTEPVELPKPFVDKDGYNCTYKPPHPAYQHEYTVNVDEQGRKYYVHVYSQDTDIPF